ncbi:cytochrome P450 [Melanomma pulvis-pyrius CBS 109.77]|uniref:Cytochrome P450 n=1 Tax=Melanomma pulvis-pyrius CBS 109.77 TaxID=1314802 RepID=A0A6A6XCR1_9PLEO|nr:cytochrome P450 [Melanomma pulvis-pyrius CBS 109.77]
MEEVLRRASTSPFVDRQATEDTQILGHHVPRGTTVLCLLRGPSMRSPGFVIDEKPRYVAKLGRDFQEGGRGNKVWEPENVFAFQPERWFVPGENGDDGDHGLQFDPTAGPQLAFGLSPRGRFGRRLVYLELRILLTLVMWRFELFPCPAALSDSRSVLRTRNEPREC